MSEETLARATEPFFTTKGIGKGDRGLVLPWCMEKLATQSGGALRLKSDLGVGTEVELWLPAATHEAEDEAPAKPSTAPDEPYRPLTILAVDDDELVLLNTAAMLEDLGHTVIQASRGEDALSALREAPTIDLVITDHADAGNDRRGPRAADRGDARPDLADGPGHGIC